MASESKCPFTGGTRAHMNRDWWPNQLDLQVLHQHSTLSNPMGQGFEDVVFEDFAPGAGGVMVPASTFLSEMMAAATGVAFRSLGMAVTGPCAAGAAPVVVAAAGCAVAVFAAAGAAF